jgi:WD40 repeat protein
MSARRNWWVLVLVLLPPAAPGAEPLPAGAVCRLDPPGTSFRSPGGVYEISADGNWSHSPRKAISPDGTLVALISDAHFVRLCRSDTKEEVRLLKGHTAYLAAVAFSPDGKTVASGSTDRTLRLWDTASGAERFVCSGHEDQVCAVAFAPDGKTVASASWDGSVRLWDVSSGKELRRLEGHRYEVRDVAFAPDGQRLASGGTDGTVRLWDPTTGKEVRRWVVHESGVRALAFTRDGTGIRTVDSAQIARNWDVHSGKELSAARKVGLPAEVNVAHCAAFAPDGQTAALGYPDGGIRLYDVKSGKELRVIGRHPEIVWSVAFSPNGKTLASSARRHGIVRLWDVATGRMVRSYPGHAGGVSRVLFSRDGQRLLAAGGSFDPSIIVSDTATARELRRLEGHTSLVGAMALSPDGQTLASVVSGDAVRLWDLATGKERRHWAPPAHSSGQEVAFTADAGGLLAVDPTNAVCVYDVRTGRCRRELAGVAPWLGISADGRLLATVTSDHAIALVEVATGQERHRFPQGGRSCGWAAFSADGRRLLADAGDGTAFVWDVTGGAAGGLTARQGDDAWRDLAADGTVAHQAIWKLILSPKESVPLVRDRLRQPPAVDADVIARRVVELDDDSFAVRERATEDLERAAEGARAALEKALASSPSAEVKRRAEALLAKLDGTPGPERLRELRALEVLETLGTPEARQVVEALANWPPAARLTREARGALERLKR